MCELTWKTAIELDPWLTANRSFLLELSRTWWSPVAVPAAFGSGVMYAVPVPPVRNCWLCLVSGTPALEYGIASTAFLFGVA